MKILRLQMTIRRVQLSGQ